MGDNVVVGCISVLPLMATKGMLQVAHLHSCHSPKRMRVKVGK